MKYWKLCFVFLCLCLLLLKMIALIMVIILVNDNLVFRKRCTGHSLPDSREISAKIKFCHLHSSPRECCYIALHSLIIIIHVFFLRKLFFFARASVFLT